MKTSLLLEAQLSDVLARIRRLHGEAEASSLLSTAAASRSTAQRLEQENSRRSARLEQMERQLTRERAEAERLRKEIASARAKQSSPKSPEESEELIALRRKHIELVERHTELKSERSRHALAGAEGDARARSALDRIADEEASTQREIEILLVAIRQREAMEAEHRSEIAQRNADEKLRAAQRAADALIEWADGFDRRLSEVAQHFAKLPELQRSLSMSGASIRTDLTNRLYITAARDRAATAAGLRGVLSYDATAGNGALGKAFRDLLRSAIARPNLGS